MQLEVNALPVAVGAGAYLLLWVVSRLSASRAPRAGKRPSTLPAKGETGKFALGESALDDSPRGLQAPREPLPEPAPEPHLPAAATPRAARLTRCRGFRVALPAAAALLAIVCWWLASREEPGRLPPAAGRPLGHLDLVVPPPVAEAGKEEEAASAEQTLEVELGEALGRPDQAAPLAVAEREKEDVEASAEQPPEEQSEEEEEGEEPQQEAEEPESGALVAQDDVVSPNNPLTVKLSRQTMDGQQADYIRSAYYGTLMVGSPPQPFTVVFDTGSGHLVLPSTYCSTPTCKAHKRYSRRASKTGVDVNYDGEVVAQGEARDQIAVSFGTGEVTGVIVEDIICVQGEGSGNSSGAVAQTNLQDSDRCVKLRMIAATDLSADPFESFKFDGVMGMGLSGLSQAPEFNFMSQLLANTRQTGRGLTSTFGVFLAENREEDSEIALGGWAHQHLSEDLSWDAVHDPDQGHWIVHVKGIRVDGVPLPLCLNGGCKAAVDTGTSLLAVPSAAFSELYQGLRHAAPKSGHCMGFGPLIHIELEHFTVTLGPRDYARATTVKNARRAPPTLYPRGSLAHWRATRIRQDVRCVPTLMTLDLPEPLGPNLIILGEPVLRKYYTVFDAERKRVGFGRARHHQAPSREDLLQLAPELDQRAGRARASRRSPTMLDVFRWRKTLR